jgi:Fe-S cluster assembly iron-binding protein IscA
MLQVTDAAVSVFKKVLRQEPGGAEVIRLVPGRQADGRSSVGIEKITQPGPNDEPAEARGLTIVVAGDLAPDLEDQVLDAQETETGADLVVRPQGD